MPILANPEIYEVKTLLGRFLLKEVLEERKLIPT